MKHDTLSAIITLIRMNRKQSSIENSKIYHRSYFLYTWHIWRIWRIWRTHLHTNIPFKLLFDNFLSRASIISVLFILFVDLCLLMLLICSKQLRFFIAKIVGIIKRIQICDMWYTIYNIHDMHQYNSKRKTLNSQPPTKHIICLDFGCVNFFYLSN